MAEYGYSFLRGYQATAPRALVASSDDEPQDDLLAVLLSAVGLKGPLSRVLSTLFSVSFWKLVARMAFHGCPAAPSASKGSLVCVES